MNNRESHRVDRVIEGVFNGFSILITAALILLGERNEDFHLARVLVLKTVLRIFSPHLSIVSIVL